jgi:hypothetical protein
MRLRRLLAPVLALLFFASTVLAAGAGMPGSTDLLRSALDPNPALRSFIAAAVLQAQLHAVVPVSKVFTGTAYYRRPDERIEFTNATGPLDRFRELRYGLPSYAQLAAANSIVLETDDGYVSRYNVTPRVARRVRALTLAVDDRSALIRRAEWLYEDGSRLTVDSSYGTVGGVRLVTDERIAARFPAYAVDGELHLEKYRLNVRVDPWQP